MNKKKTSIAPLILVIALVALGFAWWSYGGGENDDSTAVDMASDTAVDTVVRVSDELGAGVIGFTVEPPEGWGEFTVTLEKEVWPEDSASPNEDWMYLGVFSKQESLTYQAVDPDHFISTGGYPGHILGYVLKDGIYYLQIFGNQGEFPVPVELVVQEVKLAQGSALLLQGPEEVLENSPFPSAPGQLVAYLNTPNGPLSGGVFMTDPQGPHLTIDQMKAFLAGVSIQ